MSASNTALFGFTTGDRVAVAAWTDSWMKGDRFGEVLSIVRRDTVENSTVRVQLDSGSIRRFAVGALEVVE